ncbi:MAG: toxin-antitoxin system YwqK family antitoxin [Fibrobacteres bacterium]|nr:toxin-antitoxin system YwqK family antitoxin [Fibrobacterota bacterium]
MPSRFRIAFLFALALCACDDGTIHVVRFPSGKIREMWKEKGPEGKPTVREGLFQSFYSDGSKESSVEYRGGRKNGEARAWDPRGRLSFQGEYRDDFLVRETRFDGSEAASAEKRYSVKTEIVKAIGSAGDSMMAKETCAWSEAAGGKPAKHGLCTMIYDDGRTMATRYYQSGRLTGPVKAWYPDGTPWLEGAYSNDVPTGKWRTFGRSGNLMWSAAYVKGEKQGAWEEWFPDGQRKSRSSYRLGKADGGYQEWYPNGKPRLRGQFRAGKREGVETAWYPDGDRLYAARYAAGRLEGEFFQWHPGGKLRLHCRFADGKKEGPSRVWYPKGGLQELAYYHGGRLNGSYRTWSAEGIPMAMKEFRDGAVAFDSKAKELLDLLGADQLRVPVGLMGFYWGMGAKECRANLGLYQAANVRADSGEIAADMIAFPDRRATRAKIRLSFNGQGELWGIRLELLQKASGDYYPLCENLEIEMGAELGTPGVRRSEGASGYYMTRKRDWGRFTVTTTAAGGVQQDLPVLSAEAFGPGDQGWFRFSLANNLYREYVNPANASITPPRWQEGTFLAGR